MLVPSSSSRGQKDLQLTFYETDIYSKVKKNRAWSGSCWSVRPDRANRGRRMGVTPLAGRSCGGHAISPARNLLSGNGTIPTQQFSLSPSWSGTIRARGVTNVSVPGLPRKPFLRAKSLLCDHTWECLDSAGSQPKPATPTSPPHAQLWPSGYTNTDWACRATTQSPRSDR